MSGNKVYEARDYNQKDDSATPTERSRSEYLNELPQTSSQPLLNMDNMAALDSVVPAAPTIINITVRFQFLLLIKISIIMLCFLYKSISNINYF